LEKSYLDLLNFLNILLTFNAEIAKQEHPFINKFLAVAIKIKSSSTSSDDFITYCLSLGIDAIIFLINFSDLC